MTWAGRLQHICTKFNYNLVYKVCRFTSCRPAQQGRARRAYLTFALYSKGDAKENTLFSLEITRWRKHMHPFFNFFPQTHRHTAWRPPCVCSLPGKRKVAVAGRLLLQINTGLLLLVFVDASSPLLFYPSLSSVHLLFICSAVLVQYILYHPCPPPTLQIAGSSLLSPPQRVGLSRYCRPT